MREYLEQSRKTQYLENFIAISWFLVAHRQSCTAMLTASSVRCTKYLGSVGRKILDWTHETQQPMALAQDGWRHV
jgi:hypothetical protein